MPIALIAHDRMKDAIVALARDHASVLRRHRLMATGTTGLIHADAKLAAAATACSE